MKRLWISGHILAQIEEEATQKAPKETGGVLMGYFSANNDDVVLTHCIGPGPKAFHSRWTFRPDYEFHKAEVARHFDTTKEGVFYLGDWHSHPGNRAYLSWLDKIALNNIVRYRLNFVDFPIMLIMGQEQKNSRRWQPRCWRVNVASRSPFSNPAILELEIIILDN